jgi:hypothetical protein
MLKKSWPAPNFIGDILSRDDIIMLLFKSKFLLEKYMSIHQLIIASRSKKSWSKLQKYWQITFSIFLGVTWRY